MGVSPVRIEPLKTGLGWNPMVTRVLYTRCAPYAGDRVVGDIEGDGKAEN